MEKITGDSIDSSFTDKEIFFTIWTKPRQVLKYINDNHYDKFVYVLLFFAGVSRAIDRASLKDYGDKMSLLKILTLSIIVGGLFGWISYYIYSALISWTGNWLNGKGDTKSILRIISYALIPSIIALIFLIPQLSIYGIENFKADGDIFSAGLILNIVFYSSMTIELILAVFSLVFIVIGISEVQKLSIGKSILNLFLPILVIGLPILMIVLIFQAF